jgi:hypothetical protein
VRLHQLHQPFTCLFPPLLSIRSLKSSPQPFSTFPPLCATVCETFGLGTNLAAIEGSRSGITSELLTCYFSGSPDCLLCAQHSDRSFLTLRFRSRKYYFVQISTGESTWEVPTTAAPQVPTPGGTPAQMSDPFSKPGQGGSHGNGYGEGQGNPYGNNGPDGAQEGDRGFKVC